MTIKEVRAQTRKSDKADIRQAIKDFHQRQQLQVKYDHQRYMQDQRSLAGLLPFVKLT